MAGMTNGIEPRAQLLAILKARWLMAMHSLRTDEGKMELIGRVVFSLLAVLMGVGGAFGLASGAYFLVEHKRFEYLALPFWGVMLFWQFFPVLGTTFSGNLDSKNLVRFPLNYRTFYVIQLLEGLVGPTALVPCLWLIGITIGVSLANPALFLPAIAICGAFGVLNLLLSRMVLSWVERWMEQRRTREIFALVFFLSMMSMQLVGPIVQRFEHKQQELSAVARTIAAVQKPLPPGAATLAIIGVAKGEFAQGAIYFAVLVGYGAIFAKVLGMRLKAQYRGENLSEIAPKLNTKIERRLTPGWDVLGLPGPVAAIFQKEIKYVFRSGQMIMAIVSPLLMLVVFQSNAFSGHGNPLAKSAMAFPIGTALALLSVTNMYSNSFGGDGGGMQMLYAAPVTFRQIVLGKNLAHGAIFGMELALIWTALMVMGAIPPLTMLLTTVLSLVFALLAEATLGNLLSLYLPKKLDYGKFMNRQQASALAVLLNMGATAAIVGASAFCIFMSLRPGRFLAGTATLLVLAAAAAFAYRAVIGQVDQIAITQQDKLLAEVCKS